jgi:hypothetical protein
LKAVFVRVMTLGVFCVLAGTSFAQIPSAERQALFELYHATDGDNWHNNEGWLGPAGTECDWFGVRCHLTLRPGVTGLMLSNNNLNGNLPASLGNLIYLEWLHLHRNQLSGMLHEEIFSTSMSEVFLGDNQFSGTVPEHALLRPIRDVDLSHNAFESLPEISYPIPRRAARRIRLNDNALAGSIPASIGKMLETRTLDLSNNQLEGDLPDQFGDLELSVLDLGNNRLTGSIAPAIAAVDEHGRYLYLGNNRFTGPVPASLMDLDRLTVHGEFRGGGLDLCWNALDEPDDPDLQHFVNNHHLGGHMSGCQSAERIALDPESSGSWFDPARDGEGLTQMLLAGGDMLVYWFTFSPEGEQRWLFGSGSRHETYLDWPDLLTTAFGRFGQGLEAFDYRSIRANGMLRIDRTDRDQQHVLYGQSERICNRPPMPPDDGCDIHLRNVRVLQSPLTRLAGSRCDNQQPNQWISGAWYNPEANGEGFVVEVTDQGHGVVYWFTYQPDDSGRQAWMMGDGDFDGTTLVIDNLIQPVGGIFGVDFDPEQVDRVPWGSLVMEFDDDLNGHVWFDSLDDDYGSGDYPITRLARPMLADCEEH